MTPGVLVFAGVGLALTLALLVGYWPKPTEQELYERHLRRVGAV